MAANFSGIVPPLLRRVVDEATNGSFLCGIHITQLVLKILDYTPAINSFGDRLMVGQRPLKPLIGVRLPVPELFNFRFVQISEFLFSVRKF